MIGITAYGGYIPRLRLLRQAVTEANAWYAPHLCGRQGSRSVANWDEDSVTLAVAAARDCLGAERQQDPARGPQTRTMVTREGDREFVTYAKP